MKNTCLILKKKKDFIFSTRLLIIYLLRLYIRATKKIFCQWLIMTAIVYYFFKLTGKCDKWDYHIRNGNKRFVRICFMQWLILFRCLGKFLLAFQIMCFSSKEIVHFFMICLDLNSKAIVHKWFFNLFRLVEQSNSS